jgi:hypothetical protein
VSMYPTNAIACPTDTFVSFLRNNAASTNHISYTAYQYFISLHVLKPCNETVAVHAVITHERILILTFWFDCCMLLYFILPFSACLKKCFHKFYVGLGHAPLMHDEVFLSSLIFNRNGAYSKTH